ncbi:NAD(P)H-binding protein [Nonomuraea thailandensis]
MRVRTGDFTEPGTLKHAFEDAECVLVISAAIRGGGALTANLAAIDAAREAGARRILYTSHQAASPTSLFPPQKVHAATEEHLRQAGVPHTALRNGFYASTLGHYIGAALETGTLAVPLDGPVSWTAHEDLAEAAVVALAEDGALEGVTPPLTAPHTLDFADVAAILGRITGRTVTRVVMDDDEWISAAVAGGMPRPAAEFTLTMFAASRAGEFDTTDPTLETVIGHPAKTLHQVLETLVRSR